MRTATTLLLLALAATTHAAEMSSDAQAAVKAKARAEAAGFVDRAMAGTPNEAAPTLSVRPYTLTPGNGARGMPTTLYPHTRYIVSDATGTHALSVRQVFIDWGDGSPYLKAPAGVAETHVYDAPVPTQFVGRITYITAPTASDVPNARYTERFTYNMWVASASAQTGDVEGNRDNPSSPVDPVVCSTYSSANGSCTDFKPTGSGLRLENSHAQTGDGGGAHARTRDAASVVQCLRIDFFNNRFQAVAANKWQSAAQWVNVPCGGDAWMNMDGSLDSSDSHSGAADPSDMADEIAECQADQAQAQQWLAMHPAPGPEDDPETPEEQEERADYEDAASANCLDSLEEVSDNDSSYDASANTFEKHYRVSHSWRAGVHTKHYTRYADFYLGWPQFNRGTLTDICLDGNPSTIQVTYNGTLVAEGSCANDWVVEIPREPGSNTLYTNTDMDVKLNWVSTPYPSPSNHAAGGFSDDNVPVQSTFTIPQQKVQEILNRD